MELAAVDNPAEVFGPVFEKAQDALQTAIQDELANPAPIAKAIVAN